MANEAPPYSARFRRHLHPHEEQSVKAARALDERLEAMELDSLIDLLVKHGQIIGQWPQIRHMPAFHAWVTTSPLDAAAKAAALAGTGVRGGQG
jgi:hypothetical protein